MVELNKLIIYVIIFTSNMLIFVKCGLDEYLK